MKNRETISKILDYLNNIKNYKWATSEALIDKLKLRGLDPLELDDILVMHFQNTEKNELRFLILPSKYNLDVL